jgi:hypothetical protein
MKKRHLLPLITVFLVGLGCNNAEKTENTSVPTADTSASAPIATAKDTIFDPDVSDTIPGSSYNPFTTSQATAELVRQVIQTKLKSDLDKNLVDSFSRRFIFFEYDLNDDGNKEIFVGFTGPYFCGSGGCSPYILDNQGNVITHFTVSDYPIVIDNNKTNGWKDLFIRSGGKDRIVKFDGKKYPSNPSTLPALKVLPGDGLPRVLDFVNEPYPWFRF